MKMFKRKNHTLGPLILKLHQKLRVKKTLDIKNVYLEELKIDEEINVIIREIKQVFRANSDKPKQLSLIIDKYLIPEATERSKNAEVSTPFTLRQEMLNKIPEEF